MSVLISLTIGLGQPTNPIKRIETQHIANQENFIFPQINATINALKESKRRKRMNKRNYFVCASLLKRVRAMMRSYVQIVNAVKLAHYMKCGWSFNATEQSNVNVKIDRHCLLNRCF